MNTEGFAHPVRNVGAFRVEPGMSIADFGAGSGAYVHAIAELLGGVGHVYAIDIQKELLRRIKNDATKKGFHNVEIICADIEKVNGTKLKEASVDRVLISNVLFQVDDKDAVFREAKRIMKPHGRVIVIEWSDSFGGMGPHKNSVLTKERMVAHAEHAGFSVEREFQAGAHHYGVILETHLV